MFIVIEDDVFEGIEKIKDAFDPKIELIDDLFDAMIKGKHIVYSNIKNLIKIKNHPIVGRRTAKYVEWLIREYARVYSCKEVINTYISIAIAYKEVHYNKTYFEVPFQKARDIYETKLLTENESDARFYQQITRYIMKKEGISSFFSIIFDNDSYHGANAKTKIEEIAKTNKYVLCIVDTDKDYPEDRRKSTCIAANNAVKKARKTIVIELLELPVREKENLFPAKVYSEFSDSKLVRILSDFFDDNEVVVNYFDIKEGIKYKKILSPNEKWMSYFGTLVDKCREMKICNETLSEEDGEEYYVCGIGDKICEGIADTLFIGDAKMIKNHFGNMTKGEIEEKIAKRQELLDSIPDFILINWQQMASSIFSWGCCVNQSRFPAQRDW